VTTTLAGVQVLFNGVPAPLLYVSAGQINAIVPYQLPLLDFFQIQIQVQTAGGQSPITTAQLDSAFGIGIFKGAVVNPDGTINSQNNPAPPGSTLVLYGTGMGQTNPPGVDGAIIQGPNLPVPVGRFEAMIYPGGQFTPTPTQAQIAYLGPAPGLVAGVVQINLVMPPGLSAALAHSS
jgi:uncharacterized protein (TIGR03437 family)